METVVLPDGTVIVTDDAVRDLDLIRRLEASSK